MSYPASLQIDTPERIANWRPLVQWLLAIPHFVVLGVLGTVSTVVVIVAWFAVVLTGRLPAGIAGLQAMYLRYSIVVNAYASFLTTQYPPFDFDTSPADPGGSQASANFSPALEGRNRLTVLFRAITLIPAYIYTALISIVGMVCLVLGFFAVLFSGRWPAGLRRMVVGAQTVGLRFSAYGLLLTDEYPPFSID